MQRPIITRRHNISEHVNKRVAADPAAHNDALAATTDMIKLHALQFLMNKHRMRSAQAISPDQL
jgi:hypothetical protein